MPPEHRNDASALVDPDGAGPRLFFQRVPEGKQAKNRVHLDVRAAPGLEGEARMAALEAESDRLVARGATPAAALRARSPARERPHRDGRPRGQRVLPRLRSAWSGYASERAASAALTMLPGSRSCSS